MLNKGNMGKGKGDNRATFGTLAWSWSTKEGCKAYPLVPKLGKENKRIRCRGAKQDSQTQSNHTLKVQKVRRGLDEDMERDRREGRGWKLTFLLLLQQQQLLPQKSFGPRWP